MVVAKKAYNTGDYPVYGNYAYQPERVYQPDRHKEDYIKTKKDVANSLRESHMKQVKKRLKLIGIVAAMFFIGMLIIGRYAIIMELNSQSSVVQKNIAAAQKENEDLKIQLAGKDNITTIEKAASSDLGMVQPDSSAMVHIKTPVQKVTVSTNENQKDVSFLDRILKFFD